MAAAHPPGWGDRTSDVTNSTASIDAERLLDRLVRYISVASVNPKLAEGPGESELAELVASELKALGAQVELQQVAPGRHNVLGSLDAGAGLPTLTLDAHLDTVPPSGDAATTAGIDGDRVVGRGACDDKASLAAMIEAVQTVADRGGTLPANVILLGTVDEENRCVGAEAATERVGHSDLILVGEPTRLNLANWHKGTTRFEIDTLGQACHSAVPHLGSNAIELMSSVLEQLFARTIPEVASRRHPEGETATVNVGSIRGGGPLNQVPDRCRIGIDVRRLPDQTSAEVLPLFDRLIESLADGGQAIRHEPFVDSPAFASTASPATIEAILATARRHQPRSEVVGLPYGTNASRLARLGAPTFVIGPGDIDVAHTDHEYVELSETVAAAGFYLEVIDRLVELVGPGKAS